VAEKDIFLDLKDMLTADLERSGFKRATVPPGPEPVLPRRLRELSAQEVGDSCDDFQAFYNYLTDEIVFCLTYEGPTKVRLDAVRALARKRVTLDTTLTNDRARENEVEVDPEYMGAVRDYCYFKTTHEKYEEWRRKISKSMERLYRELLGRGGVTRQAPPSHFGRAPMPSATQGATHAYAFKSTRGPDLPGPPDDTAAFGEQDVHQDP